MEPHRQRQQKESGVEKRHLQQQQPPSQVSDKNGSLHTHRSRIDSLASPRKLQEESHAAQDVAQLLRDPLTQIRCRSQQEPQSQIQSHSQFQHMDTLLPILDTSSMKDFYMDAFTGHSPRMDRLERQFVQLNVDPGIAAQAHPSYASPADDTGLPDIFEQSPAMLPDRFSDAGGSTFSPRHDGEVRDLFDMASPHHSTTSDSLDVADSLDATLGDFPAWGLNQTLSLLSLPPPPPPNSSHGVDSIQFSSVFNTDSFFLPDL